MIHYKILIRTKLSLNKLGYQFKKTVYYSHFINVFLEDDNISLQITYFYLKIPYAGK
jgi:hypothetical protein